MSSRKKVEIPDKAWLDTLKFLMGPQWLKMRFVSHQLAEVVRGNISELPRVIIDNVKFSEDKLALKSTEMMSYDILIPQNEKKEWFTKRGINLNAPTALQHQDAIIGMGAKHGNQHKASISYYADVNELSEASKTIRPKRKTVWRKLGCVSNRGYQEYRRPVIFSAAFNPDLNEYSWASMKYFLNLLYSPLTYIRNVEMYALNKNLTDALFLGEDYGSYIHCGKFTLLGDLCKSLPWMQKNVRADTIYFSRELFLMDVEYSGFTETSHFLLDSSWMCANQAQNVKAVKIKLERVYNWKWFIKALIKKFRTLPTIEHATPSIEFSFWKFPDERPDLNYLIWDPEVVKLKPEDSQGAEAAYMISNGRNRMVIAIFKRHEIERVSIFELDGSRDAVSRYNNSMRLDPIYDVSVKTYTIPPAATSQKTFDIENDIWLEALKFLSFSNWSKALFVSRQLAGVVQENISRLPCIVIDSATISENTRLSSDIIAFDFDIISEWRNQFFNDLWISLNAPAAVQHENVFIGLSRKNWNSRYHYIEMHLSGTAQDLNQSRKTAILSTRFNKYNEHSWAFLKYFLEFLYYPALCIKEVEMFALNQKMIDDYFDGETRFLRCNAFTLRGETEWSSMDKFRESLLWLERNVRANTIHFPEHIDYKNENIYESIANFLLDASWKCARQEVNFKCICDVNSFVTAIVQKLQAVSFVLTDIPILTAFAYGNDKTMSFLNQQKSENKENRMQIEVFKADDLQGYENCYDNRKYHDNFKNQGLHRLKVSIKVNPI
ncbi:hypothetical protein Ddc_22870 [Ditylenchus destructor]|nr:hypothetical protein Ddc_22870 [Ditylenchus destructor]